MQGGCAGGGDCATNDWLGIYDAATGLALTTEDPFAGTATLPGHPDKPLVAATRLTDGRVVLVADGSWDVATGGPNPIDIVR